MIKRFFSFTTLFQRPRGLFFYIFNKNYIIFATATFSYHILLKNYFVQEIS